jgi:hypothetical protein
MYGESFSRNGPMFASRLQEPCLWKNSGILRKGMGIFAEVGIESHHAA